MNKKTLAITVTLAVFLAVAAWMAWEIFDRSTQQQLWGYRPMVLFLSGWLSIVAFLHRKHLFSLRPDHPLTWSTVSGLLLGLGFPGDVGWFFLMFIAFVPLFKMEELIGEEETGRRSWRVFGYGFHAFILWNILSTYWLSNASLPAGLFTIAANAALMALVLLLLHQSKKRISKFHLLPFVAYWLLFEYFHYRWELAWPWLTLGNSLAEWPALIQWYDHTGVLGGSLWILLANILVFQGWGKYRKKEKWRPEAILLILLLLIPGLWSAFRHSRVQVGSGAAEVVIVQPGFEPHYEKRSLPATLQMSRLVELALPKLTEQTDYLVFPEGTLGYFELDRLEAYPQIGRLRELQSEYPNLKIVAGMSLYDDLGTEKVEGPFVREREEGGQKIYYEVYNAAVQLTPEVAKVDLYRKSKLVPGPEFFPFSRLLGFLKPLVESLGGTTASFGTQKERAVFESTAGKVAPVICYESAFGEYLTAYTRKGAQAIFIMTNDGWWDNTAGHRQHKAIARIRAIENRRPVARAASTGVSCFIDARGRTRLETQYGSPTAIKDKIDLRTDVTFYLQWGDMIGRLAMFVSILFLLNTFVKGLLPKAK